MRHSDDNGATWSAALRVNDDHTTNSQFLPKISLDPTTGNPGTNLVDVYIGYQRRKLGEPTITTVRGPTRGGRADDDCLPGPRRPPPRRWLVLPGQASRLLRSRKF